MTVWQTYQPQEVDTKKMVCYSADALLTACFRLFNSAQVKVSSDRKDGFVFRLQCASTKLSMKFKIRPPEGKIGRLWSRLNDKPGETTQWQTANIAHKLMEKMGGTSVLWILVNDNPDFHTTFGLAHSMAATDIDRTRDINTRVKAVADMFTEQDISYDGQQRKFKLSGSSINVKLYVPA